MIRIAPSAVIGLVAALASWPAVADDASGPRVWHGTNGWEVTYMPIPGRPWYPAASWCGTPRRTGYLTAARCFGSGTTKC
jgi:hypothetical protein